MTQLDRRLLGLAVPALGALAVEPVYGLVDTAIVGRLGRSELGGLMLLALVPFAVPAALTLWLRWPGIAGVWLALGCWLAARAFLLGRRWRAESWLPVAAPTG